MNTSPLSSAIHQLLQLWQQIAHHQGNGEPIYAWLTAQSPQWQSDMLLPALPLAAAQLLTQPNPASRKAAALVIATFGNLMQFCPSGVRSLNLELAIVAYQQALSALTPTESPDAWATTLSNLATVYRHRCQGNRATNLELAIQAYQQALSVQNSVQLTAERVTSLVGLATAYSERIQGDRAENLKRAINIYQAALSAISSVTMPLEWAVIMNQLAAAYGELSYNASSQNDLSQNVDKAIWSYQHALNPKSSRGSEGMPELARSLKLK